MADLDLDELERDLGAIEVIEGPFGHVVATQEDAERLARVVSAVPALIAAARERGRLREENAKLRAVAEATRTMRVIEHAIADTPVVAPGRASRTGRVRFGS